MRKKVIPFPIRKPIDAISYFGVFLCISFLVNIPVPVIGWVMVSVGMYGMFANYVNNKLNKK